MDHDDYHNSNMSFIPYPYFSVTIIVIIISVHALEMARRTKISSLRAHDLSPLKKERQRYF